MRTRTDVIQFLIDKFGYEKYLEVGVQYKQNWNDIKCKHKVGVEPNNLNDPDIYHGTSNEFFKANTDKFDIIFIDGDHNYNQVIIDIRESLNILNDGGCIVCHDSYPLTIEMTHEYSNGTVYKAICDIRSESGFDICTFQEDHGVCVIRKGNMTPYPCKGMSYDEFFANAKEILNLKDGNEFKKYFV